MRMRTEKRTAPARQGLSLAFIAFLAACQAVPPAAMPPPPSPAAAPPSVALPPPPPPPRPPVPQQTWDVAPLAPGNWSYRTDGEGTVALFGERATQALVAVHCRRARRVIEIAWVGEPPAAATLTIRTSAGVLTWPASALMDGPGSFVVQRAASDSGFDWIAFSRGRIALEVPGDRLVVPVWAELQRVIEDCRG